MKTIEQEIIGDLKVDVMESCTWIDHGDHTILINKQGAKQLIEVLKEWVGDETT